MTGLGGGRRLTARRAVQMLAGLLAAALVLSLAPRPAEAAPRGDDGCFEFRNGEADAAAVDEFEARNYICFIYELFLHEPSEAEIQYWTGLLDIPVPRQSVTFPMIFSTEASANFVELIYDLLLDRDSDPSGNAFYAGMLENGATLEDVVALIVASEEYFHEIAGGTNEDWVISLYNDLLLRDPAAAEVDFWEGVLAGGASRHQVATFFVGSQEWADQWVEILYEIFLDREPEAAAFDFWGDMILDEGLRFTIATILATDEAYEEIGNNFFFLLGAAEESGSLAAPAA